MAKNEKLIFFVANFFSNGHSHDLAGEARPFFCGDVSTTIQSFRMTMLGNF
jgi:hypothetical protein